MLQSIEQPQRTLPCKEELAGIAQLRATADVAFAKHMNVRCPRLLIAEDAAANLGL